ncbi:MAG TPA: N-glycosylase/DNA lyase [Nanoarchaeota archaeon]|nr:N-glycosylase/DNA lyase [Candidatus Woesearchaeota archaeon]HIH15339.1 N-glycosylase/DNA lyase [Nanoarchaeota archaeon]HIH59229.1 N-glycosylase/DNA lyase [Nanoarchaeota archaeon]HIJ05545.1 N-glycosylase/DNA lyase [Nanoarchaeota archaeon]
MPTSIQQSKQWKKSSEKWKELYHHYEKHKKAIKERLQEFKQVRDEKKTFREICFCILAANTSSKMASRVMNGVGEVIFTGSEQEIRERLHALSCRFYNKRAEYIFLARNVPIKFERDYLAENIKGFGYKESSHFLRNMGHSDYAILDKHVLRAMQEFGIIKKIPTMNKKNYLILEKKLKLFSKYLNISMDELDFVLWSRKSGEILK